MLELLLRILDWILNIKVPVDYTPPDPERVNTNGTKVLPAEMKELADFYKEANSDMRALRDWEFKVVSLYFQVSAFFFAGNMVLFASPSPYIHLTRLCIGSLTVLFLAAFWFRVHWRIAHDNKSYGFNMSHRRYAERLWFGKVFPRPPDHVMGGPTGPGYRKMQALVALVAVATIASLVVGLVLLTPPLDQLLCGHCK